MRGNRFLSREIVLCCVCIIITIWIVQPDHRKKIISTGGASALRAGLAGLLVGGNIESSIARSVVWALVSATTVIF